jgi:hypothetical protein
MPQRSPVTLWRNFSTEGREGLLLELLLKTGVWQWLVTLELAQLSKEGRDIDW